MPKKKTTKKITLKTASKKAKGTSKKSTAKKKGWPPRGNQLWKLRSSHGRNLIFKNPDDLWDACCEYFEWIDKHPLTAAELVKYQGEAKRALQKVYLIHE